MNVAQESDRAALELLAVCLAEVRRAHEYLRLEGRVLMNDKGDVKVSPHFKIMSQMIAQAVAIMKEFGMTPAARTRVKAMAQPEKKSRLGAFLDGGDE